MGICPGTVVPIASALPRCRVAQTVRRTVCYCSLFDSHPYKKTKAPTIKVSAFILERVMGIEPTRPAWKAGILAIELHPHYFAKSIITHFLSQVKSFKAMTEGNFSLGLTFKLVNELLKFNSCANLCEFSLDVFSVFLRSSLF